MTKRYHHGDLRQALLDATLKLLKEKPAAQVSVSDAARELGVSSGAPYRHFKDKDSLLAEVAAIGFTRLRQRMEREVTEFEPGSVDCVCAIGNAYIAFSAENPELFHAMWGSARLKASHAVVREAAQNCYGRFIETLVQTMKATGFSDREPTAFGAPLWTMVHGYASLLVAENRMLDSDPSAIRRQVSDATRAYFAGMTSVAASSSDEKGPE